MNKSSISITVLLVLATLQARAAVESVFIHNDSGIDITVNVEYEDHSTETRSLSANEKLPIYVEDKCVLGLTIYSGRWGTVADIESDDKLVIPDSWNRCQAWEFTIKKRIDDTVHIASKKRIPDKAD